MFNRAMIKRVIWEAIRGAIGGAFGGTLVALIGDHELVLSWVITGAIFGAVFGGVRSLGKDSLWLGIANINTGIIFVTFIGGNSRAAHRLL